MVRRPDDEHELALHQHVQPPRDAHHAQLGVDLEGVARVARGDRVRDAAVITLWMFHYGSSLLYLALFGSKLRKIQFNRGATLDEIRSKISPKQDMFDCASITSCFRDNF